MKFFIINNDYDDFIEKDYKDNPFLKNKSFEEQLQHRYDTYFGVSNFYSKNLKILGYEAIDIFINHRYIQRQWAKENNIDIIQFEFNEMNIISRVFLKDYYELLPQYNFYRISSKYLIPMPIYKTENEIFKFQNILAINKSIE